MTRISYGGRDLDLCNRPSYRLWLSQLIMSGAVRIEGLAIEQDDCEPYYDVRILEPPRFHVRAPQVMTLTLVASDLGAIPRYTPEPELPSARDMLDRLILLTKIAVLAWSDEVAAEFAKLTDWQKRVALLEL